ncbi:hypothetical protein QBC46DRAFT_383968 [Diplogelasinospora grovesii]|uniref:Secreted protein n=1 Tax=Diplogelasinospora grovesii TaxID=303347 RepID=A0AAN6S5A4_9PEZI|nr:hypothetical protein QBC46DRAFT_383968 [Diplogelasinospora grovesii]
MGFIILAPEIVWFAEMTSTVVIAAVVDSETYICVHHCIESPIPPWARTSRIKIPSVLIQLLLPLEPFFETRSSLIKRRPI